MAATSKEGFERVLADTNVRIQYSLTWCSREPLPSSTMQVRSSMNSTTTVTSPRQVLALDVFTYSKVGEPFAEQPYAVAVQQVVQLFFLLFFFNFLV